jgi:hypothetical protein
MTFFDHLYKDHEKEELIRTVDSVIGIILQVTTLGVQVFGLWWIMHHSH